MSDPFMSRSQRLVTISTDLVSTVVHVDEDLGARPFRCDMDVTVDTKSVEIVTRRCDRDMNGSDIGTAVPGHARSNTPRKPHGGRHH